MEGRKLQLTGGSTYVVSLPKPWISATGLKPGDTVFLESMPDGSISVLPRAGEKPAARRKVFEEKGDETRDPHRLPGRSDPDRASERPPRREADRAGRGPRPADRGGEPPRRGAHPRSETPEGVRGGERRLHRDLRQGVYRPRHPGHRPRE